MAFESTLEPLFKEEILDTAKILNQMLNPKNINMKTHIQAPVTFAILGSFIKNFQQLLSGVKKSKYPLTYRILNDFIKELKEYLVSWNRLDRTEIKEILQATKAEESGARSIFQKLAGLGK